MEWSDHDKMKDASKRVTRLAGSVFLLPWATIVIGEFLELYLYIYLLIAMSLLPIISLVYSANSLHKCGDTLYGQDLQCKHGLWLGLALSLLGVVFWLLLVGNI